MGQKYCLTSAQWKYAQACLTLAKRFGLIDDDSPEALEKRCAAKNAETVAAERNGQVTYGTRCYNIAAYLQYELTRFRLDFVEPSDIGSARWASALILRRKKRELSTMQIAICSRAILTTAFPMMK